MTTTKPGAFAPTIVFVLIACVLALAIATAALVPRDVLLWKRAERAGR